MTPKITQITGPGCTRQPATVGGSCGSANYHPADNGLVLLSPPIASFQSESGLKLIERRARACQLKLLFTKCGI